MMLVLLINATVVDSNAIRLVSMRSDGKLKSSSSNSDEDDKESSEPDYDEDKDQLEEEQEEEAGEIGSTTKSFLNWFTLSV